MSHYCVQLLVTFVAVIFIIVSYIKLILGVKGKYRVSRFDLIYNILFPNPLSLFEREDLIFISLREIKIFF